MFGDLNDAQREAVTHGEGPLLIVAGAGTGKTTTLAARVAWLVEQGVRPERMLLLTFSRRAAREMLSRAERLSGARDTGRVMGGTFHAVANRLLRLHGRPLGLRPDFTVLDQADAADVMNLLRDELGFSARERRFPRKETLAGIYSRTVNAGEKLGDVLQRHYPWCLDEAEGIREIFQAYTARKRAQNVLDYDDLLLFWKALAWSEATRGPLAAMFDHVLVDEYQDTNALQADILEGLRPEGTPRNLTVVGDDAQSIYGFRAATVRNILEFPDRFPGATVVKLERNYRSTTPILGASNAVISLSPQRHEKTLWSDRPGERAPTLRTCLDEAEQCDAVCRTVLEHREEGVPLKEQAVLFRTGHHSDLLEVELARRNIPFVKFGGLKFMEAAHVKDTLALLRVLENPFDEISWFRVLAAARRDGSGDRAAADGPARRAPGRRRAAVAARRVPRGTARGAQGGRRGDPGAAERARGMRRRDEAHPRRAGRAAPHVPRAGVREAVRGARRPARRPGPARAPRDRLRGPWPVPERAHPRSAVIHRRSRGPSPARRGLPGPVDDPFSAKGLEWDVVHVIHAADGMIPSDMATGDDDEIEEERRLLYVALTRPRDALHVYLPMRYYRRPRGLEDPHSYAQLSRFLAPDEVRARFEAIAPATEPEPDGVVDLSGTADVDAFLAGLWAD